jgi:SAM-dependent methyltransferase
MRLKTLYHRAQIALEGIKGNRGMVPPEKMVFTGKGDFLKIGEDFKGHLVDLAGLRPDSRVLDVGSGIGRMAIPLTGYLTTGEYAGIDIVEKGIDWCNARITPRHPNFRFIHTDIYNKAYNKRGRTLAKDYRFPFADGYYDVVFLTSVFTHMLPADLENYVREIARVMKPGGRCLMTLFLRNEESIRLVESGSGTMPFRHKLDGCWTIDRDVPEKAIAYDEDYLVALCERNGLRVQRPISYGSWCGRGQFLSFQDIVIVEKA